MEGLKCFECREPLDHHKLSCGSRYFLSQYAYVIDNIHRLPYEYLEKLSFACWAEEMKRKEEYYE